MKNWQKLVLGGAVTGLVMHLLGFKLKSKVVTIPIPLPKEEVKQVEE